MQEILSASYALLTEGATDPASVWRSPTLATIGQDGTPQARTIVLRRFDPPSRLLELHTDARSAKHAELLAHPACHLHGWDADRQIQLRLAGVTTLHRADSVADAAWQALRPKSRDTYRVQPGPGTSLTAPDEARVADDLSARAVFCVIRLRFDGLEWLRPEQGSHRRARFAWAGDVCTAMWLVP